MASTHYGNLIWTNHALDRLSQRGLSQEKALIAFRNPDNSSPGSTPGSMQFTKYFGSSKVTLVGKENERREWIIISAWIDPPFPGSADDRKQRAFREYRDAKGWKKIFLSVMRQIGF